MNAAGRGEQYIMSNKIFMQVTKVVDGDTVYGRLISEDLEIELPKQKFRFLGVNTPERNRLGYQEAKDFTAQICSGKTLEITVHGKDDFGRWLVVVYYKEDELVKSLNDELLRLQLAVVFED